MRLPLRVSKSVLVLVCAGTVGALTAHAVFAAPTRTVSPTTGRLITQVKYLGGGDATSSENDNGDEVGISSEETQTWSTMILPGFGQGSCCPSDVPAVMRVRVPPGTKAFFRVTVSGQVNCFPNGSVTNESACFVRVLVGNSPLEPDSVVFARSEPLNESVLRTDSHSAQFVSSPLRAGTYRLEVQWSTLEASFTSDQMLITVDRVKVA